MSKSRSFFGLRRGSTKNFTFTVDNGKQVTKERADFVKNPRTPQQMVNRLLMATTTAAYSGLKDIVDHSFEGVQYGRDSMAEFIRRNYAMLRQDAQSDTPAAAYNPYRDRNIRPNTYIIATGSGEGVPVGFCNVICNLPNVLFSMGYTEPNQILRILRINVGDVLTMVGLGCVNDNRIQGKCFPFYIRMKFIKAGSADITGDNFSEYIELETNLTGQSFEIEPGTLSISWNVEGLTGVGSYNAPIISRKTENGWSRSDATLKAVSAGTPAPSFADALATYPKGRNYLLNGAPL